MSGTAAVVPYYQWAPGRLVAAVRSVLAQQGVGPVTVVVCDDGSPSPASADLALLDDAERDRVVLVEQANAGAGAARNAALDAVPAGTAWIAFLDSDDQWYPHHLARAIEALEAGHDLCFSDARREHEVLTHYDATGFQPTQHAAVGRLPGLHRLGADFLTLNVGLSPVSISTVVMRASVLGDVRFQPIAVEDLMFWFDVGARRPRVAFDATLQVLYGRGGITVNTDWTSRAELRMSLMYQRVFARVMRTYGLSNEQRGILGRRMAWNRGLFCRIALAQLRNRAGPDGGLVRDFLRIDPLVAATLGRTAVVEVLRRSPFGHLMPPPPPSFGRDRAGPGLGAG